MSMPNPNRKSWFEATARERIEGLVDLQTFTEYLRPETSTPSKHLAALDLAGAFDDGVVIGAGKLGGKTVYVAAQEGQFMGGAVGETHGAKIVGLLKKAIRDKPSAVILLVDSGGVRLHEANAGLIAISEIMRAVLDTRAAGIPVVALVGGTCGAFGGMGIVTCLCSAIVMSEEGRLALSGPEVIETVAGVEEFDSKDRALVWRVTGGKNRFLMGDAAYLVDDDVPAFRSAAEHAMTIDPVLTVKKLMADQARLEIRQTVFEAFKDGLEVWAKLGVRDPESVPMLDTAEMHALKEGLTA
ncbi:MAG: biotin-independent malonate decarboxylase subunit beta [Fluviibacter sp.]